jgi:hypothetical protein
MVRTYILWRDVDFRPEVILGWSYRLARWRRLISLLILVIGSLILWVAILRLIKSLLP